MYFPNNVLHSSLKNFYLVFVLMITHQYFSAQKADSAWLRTNTNVPFMQAALTHPQRQNDAIHY